MKNLGNLLGVASGTVAGIALLNFLLNLYRLDRAKTALIRIANQRKFL
jgi:hypothetical protein